mmetsp:Transcript_35338/g.82564  ORF Transcript_35338/g.82564 Transcript_35338/m.82564 type:complete len:1196 (+) Transcript_35338:246-3833(+)
MPYKYRFDLYVRYTVEIELNEWLNSLSALNERANHDFANVLRQYFPNLQMYACQAAPGGYAPPNPVLLQSDQDVDSYMRSMNGCPIFEVRMPQTYNAWDTYNQWYSQQNSQLQHLQGQVTELRKAGQGLQQGFSLLQQASNQQEPSAMVSCVQNYGEGIDPCITCMVGQPGDAWTAHQGTRLVNAYASASPQNMTEIQQSNGFEAVITAMKNFPSDSSVQQNGCQFVAMAAQNPEYHTELHRLGAVEPMVKDMQHFQSDPNVMKYGCWGLGQLASSPEWRSEIVRLNGLEPMIQAMKQFPADPEVNRWACQGLQPFATQGEYASQVVNYDGIQPMVTALQNHGRDPQVTYHCLTSLSELSRHTDSKVAVVNAGAIPAILQTMKGYSDAPMVQETGLRCLAGLAHGSQQNQAAIFHAGGLPAVGHAMNTAVQSGKKDEHTVGLVAQGLNLQANLASHLECRPQIVQNRGIDSAVSSMRAYPDEAAVQEHGLRMFAGLANSPEAFSALQQAGAVEQILKSMSHMPGEAAVQANGAYALGMLAGHDDGKKRVLANSGVESLLSAMFHHQVPMVHEQACAALAVLVADPNAKSAFMTCSVGIPGEEPLNGYQILEHCLKNMSHHPGTMRQCLKLIAILAADETIKKKLLEMGLPEHVFYVMQEANNHPESEVAVFILYYSFKALVVLFAPYPSSDWAAMCSSILEIVVATMRRYPNDEKIQEGGCEVLSILAKGEGLQELVMKSGGVQVTCVALKTFAQDMEVQRKGCRTLANMAEYAPSRPLIRQEGGVLLVMAALKYFSQHPEVGEQGCAALANMALDDETRYEIVRQGAIDLILGACKNHARHPGIRAYGIGALANIAVDEEHCIVILRAGGLDMVIDAMTTWPDDTRVQHFCCLAISNFSHDDANKVLITQRGGLKLIIVAMQRHADHGGVIEQACGALANLGTSQKTMIDIANLQGIEYVVAGLKKHTMCQGVQENACFALSKFLSTPNESYRQRMKAAGAEEALVVVKDTEPSFDVRICVSVLLRRLGEEKPTHQAYQMAGSAKAKIEVNKEDNTGNYANGMATIAAANGHGVPPNSAPPNMGLAGVTSAAGTGMMSVEVVGGVYQKGKGGPPPGSKGAPPGSQGPPGGKGAPGMYANLQYSGPASVPKGQSKGGQPMQMQGMPKGFPKGKGKDGKGKDLKGKGKDGKGMGKR